MAKNTEMEFEKKVGRKLRSKRPKGRSKGPKEKGGQKEKLQRETVCWDPALPRWLKRSITGENISFNGFDDEQKLLMTHP